MSGASAGFVPVNPASDTAPRLRLPDRQGIFTTRAARFAHLANTQPALADYLRWNARLAQAQHQLALEASPPPLPPQAPPDSPPLAVSLPRGDSAWHGTLQRLVEALVDDESTRAEPGERIRQASTEELNNWAAALLTGTLENIDPGVAPFVAASLQVHWVSAAARLDAARIAPPDPACLCPVCGFLPVASLLQTGGTVQGLRYLVCGLCGSEWNRPRLHCVHCGTSRDVAYFNIDGAGEAVKAEACGSCKSYVKQLNREKDPRLEPCADDVASLSLDILMAEAGYQRLGFNPLLIAGR